MSVSKTIHISSDEMRHITAEAKRQKRSVDAQAEHWMRIGRAIEKSPHINYEQVKRASQALINEVDLTHEEYKLYEEEFLASFRIDDCEPVKLDPKYAHNGNFTGIDEDGVFWGYDKNGKFGPIPLV